ncbi:MAG: sugar transferase [Lentimicrobiaceae bacterium]|jgi:lipopolysaccharide/colanic/teichoic acid biosynthesis glycosyltransferase|nr:sugar transferase [Lentimicrobiaceae bacterium]MDD4598282.1 sugar transferase [Lentimicrobiaceae bacterium]MDY0025700.1 sugar transferase [Lentimicrobium sp.]
MLKRLFDIMASFFGMLLLLPVFIVVAILIKIKMPGPIFFKQQRVGKDAKLFRMVKFRTMKVNHGGSTISVKGESRITPLGQTLRKYKLDELPELWNIFKGDMSFVGPRPDVPGYADKLEGDDRLLLTIRPGLTGTASLKFSNEEELLALQEDPIYYNDHVLYPEKVRLNNNYVKRMSFWLDIKIIVFTLLGKKLKEPWFN